MIQESQKFSVTLSVRQNTLVSIRRVSIKEIHIINTLRNYTPEVTAREEMATILKVPKIRLRLVNKVHVFVCKPA